MWGMVYLHPITARDTAATTACSAQHLRSPSLSFPSCAWRSSSQERKSTVIAYMDGGHSHMVLYRPGRLWVSGRTVLDRRKSLVRGGRLIQQLECKSLVVDSELGFYRSPKDRAQHCRRAIILWTTIGADCLACPHHAAFAFEEPNIVVAALQPSDIVWFLLEHPVRTRACTFLNILDQAL